MGLLHGRRSHAAAIAPVPTVGRVLIARGEGLVSRPEIAGTGPVAQVVDLQTGQHGVVGRHREDAPRHVTRDAEAPEPLQVRRLLREAERAAAAPNEGVEAPRQLDPVRQRLPAEYQQAAEGFPSQGRTVKPRDFRSVEVLPTGSNTTTSPRSGARRGKTRKARWSTCAAKPIRADSEWPRPASRTPRAPRRRWEGRGSRAGARIPAAVAGGDRPAAYPRLPGEPVGLGRPRVVDEDGLLPHRLPGPEGVLFVREGPGPALAT